MSQFGPRAKWRVVSVSNPDPTEFAKEYESKLNELSSDGWNITGILPKGDALIIQAQKPDIPDEMMKVIAALSKESQPAPERKIPFQPRDENTIEEVVYNYKEGHECKAVRCGSLSEATDYLEEHIREDGAILPINIVVMTVTSYEPADLPMLRSICPK